MNTQNNTVVKLAETALLAALCYVSFTFLQIKIPVPGGDATSIHIGNAFCVLAALLLGGVYGGLSGAIGMGIADIMDPVYITGAPKTFVLKFCIGLIVGLVAKKWKFGIVPAVITGIALSFICPAIGTPIGIYVYGGLNGSVSDMLVMSLVQGGKSIFQASFLRNVASNLIDKIGTCIIGCLLIKAMPMRFMDNFKKEA